MVLRMDWNEDSRSNYWFVEQISKIVGLKNNFNSENDFWFSDSDLIDIFKFIRGKKPENDKKYSRRYGNEIKRRYLYRIFSEIIHRKYDKSIPIPEGTEPNKLFLRGLYDIIKDKSNEQKSKPYSEIILNEIEKVKIFTNPQTGKKFISIALKIDNGSEETYLPFETFKNKPGKLYSALIENIGDAPRELTKVSRSEWQKDVINELRAKSKLKDLSQDPKKNANMLTKVYGFKEIKNGEAHFFFHDDHLKPHLIETTEQENKKIHKIKINGIETTIEERKSKNDDEK